VVVLFNEILTAILYIQVEEKLRFIQCVSGEAAVFQRRSSMTLELGGGQGSPQVEGRTYAFLLRCWQEADGGAGGAPAWRFSLTHVDSKREKKGFTDLEVVLAYLQQILDAKNCKNWEEERP
jgi:hypothetical protein